MLYSRISKDYFTDMMLILSADHKEMLKKNISVISLQCVHAIYYYSIPK